MALLGRRVSASDLAYGILRKQIVEGDIKPNAPAGEESLATLLGLSRTPIRAALARLERDGLVEALPRGGFAVAPIRPRAFRSAQFIRETIEVAVVREASQANPRPDLSLVRGAIADQRKAVRGGDVEWFIRADEDMHFQICALLRGGEVWLLIETAKSHIERLRHLDQVNKKTLQILLNDHIEIVDAIERGDPDAAEGSLRTHTRRSLDRLDHFQLRFPEYFVE